MKPDALMIIMAALALTQIGAAAQARAPDVPLTANGRGEEPIKSYDADSAQWPVRDKSNLGFRFSSLRQITAQNVQGLKPVCSFDLGEQGSFQSGPIVREGVLYVTSALNTFAVDAANCKTRWTHHYEPGHVVTKNNKGAVLAGDRLIRGTPDGHLLALDARSGRLLWDRQIMDSTNGEYATAAPLVWRDLVFIGKAGGDRGIRGQMMAFRIYNGEHVWTFNTIPGPGEVGFETWKIPASIEHGGGGTWTSYSLDEKLGLLLIPVGNPGPDFDNDVRPGSNLFTDSLVALDARTGKLRWWHQLLSPDDRDWDTAVVASFDTSDGHKLAATAGKDGVLHVVDRTNGQLRFKAPLVSQYLNTTSTIPGEPGIRLCPIAAVQWNGPAFSPQTNLVYMNGIDWCALAIKGPTPVYQKGQEYLGWANYYGTRDPVEQAFGWVNAIDAATGQIVWRYRAATPPLGAVTVTAGGVVFTGEISGDLLALDATTGAELYKGNLGGAIGGGIITYETHGRQLVAVAAGDNNPTYGTTGENKVFILGL